MAELAETNRPRRHGRRIAAAWLLAALALAPAGASAESVELTALALSGDSAPGGNGTFQLFGTPSINESGQVVFGVTLTGTVPADPNARGVYLADELGITELVRVGDPAPDGNGTFIGFSYEPNVEERFAINANGTVAFLGQLDDTSAGLPTFDDAGLFLASASSGVTQLVRLGDSAPDDNGVFGPQDPEVAELSLLPPGLDDAGAASFFGVLFQTSGGMDIDDEGVFRADPGDVAQLARTGSMIPGTSDTFGEIEMQIASNAAGEVALVGRLALGGPPPFPVDFERIYVDDGASFSEFFRTGSAPPDGDGIISSISEVVMAESGEVVFQAMVIEAGEEEEEEPILFASPTAAVSRLWNRGLPSR